MNTEGSRSARPNGQEGTFPGKGDDGELVAIADQLREALVARAGDDPSMLAAWSATAQARSDAERRSPRVRPIQVLAAAAVVIVAVAVGVKLRGTSPEIQDVEVPAASGSAGSTAGQAPRVSTVDSAEGSMSGSSSTVTVPATLGQPVPSSTKVTTSGPPPSGPTTTDTTVTPPTQTLALRGDGVGVAKFGDNDEMAIVAVSASLGQPSEDHGYSGPGLWAFRTRGVRWGNLTLIFAERNGGRDFAGWSYDSQFGQQVLPLPNSLTLGLSVSALVAEAPQPLRAGDLEGSTGLCFEDSASKICAVLDPPWQKPGTPDSGTVVAYVAGLLAT